MSQTENNLTSDTEITYRTAIEMFASLRAMGGRTVIVKTKNDGEQVVHQSYNFSTKVILAVSKNIAKLKPVIESYNDAVASVKGKYDSPDENQDKIQSELNKIVVEPCGLKMSDFVKIPFSGMNIDKNNISPGDLAPLLPLIEGDES